MAQFAEWSFLSKVRALGEQHRSPGQRRGAWDGGGERNAWLRGAGEEGESKCSSGGYYWKDIIEEEFINPWGF